MPIPPGKESVSAPAASTEVTRLELPYRLRQQSLLGEFGRLALQTRDIDQILQRATELCAQGLETSFAKVLEYQLISGCWCGRGSGGRRERSATSLSGSMWNLPPATLPYCSDCDFQPPAGGNLFPHAEAVG